MIFIIFHISQALKVQIRLISSSTSVPLGMKQHQAMSIFYNKPGKLTLGGSWNSQIQGTAKGNIQFSEYSKYKIKTFSAHRQSSFYTGVFYLQGYSAFEYPLHKQLANRDYLFDAQTLCTQFQMPAVKYQINQLISLHQYINFLQDSSLKSIVSLHQAMLIQNGNAPVLALKLKQQLLQARKKQMLHEATHSNLTKWFFNKHILKTIQQASTDTLNFMFGSIQNILAVTSLFIDQELASVIDEVIGNKQQLVQLRIVYDSQDKKITLILQSVKIGQWNIEHLKERGSAMRESDVRSYCPNW